MTATTTEALPHKRIVEVLWGLMSALFTAMVSTTIVSTALPTIVGELRGSQTQYTWVVTSSLLCMTVTTPMWAKLSDLVSKKLLVQLAIMVFVLGSVVSGFSQGMTELLLGRGLQGLGMGGLIALTQSILGSIISPRERGRYSGYMSATMAIATFTGPLIGGALVDTVGWRWCFFVCVPMAVVSLVVLQKTLVLHQAKRRVQIDYLGAILIAIAASLPMLWVTFAGQSFDWISVESALFLLGTLLAVIAIVFVEWKHPEPLISLKIIADRTTALAIMASLAVGVSQFGSTVFLSQYFQDAQGFSPTHAGLLMMPMIVGTFIGSAGSGILISRTGYWKRYLVSGTAFLILGLAVMSPITHTSPVWQLSIGMVLLGLGTGMLMQNLVLVVQNTVDVRDVGAASGAVAFFRTLGGAVGIAILGAVLASRVHTKAADGFASADIDGSKYMVSLLDQANMPDAVRVIVQNAYADATGRIFMIAAVIGVVSLISVLFIKEIPLRTTISKKSA